MMDLIPVLIDGAVVFNLQNSCTVRNQHCENCTHLLLNVHNWIRHAELEYTILDFQDEKDICPTFLEEVLLLRKRLNFPFLFAGVMDRPRMFIEQYKYHTYYPLFATPEDAVRALRIMHPNLTEIPVKMPIKFGFPLLMSWKQFQGETWGVNG